MNKSIETGRMLIGQSVALAPTDHTEDECWAIAEWRNVLACHAIVPDDGDAYWAVEFVDGDLRMLFVSDQSAFVLPAPHWATHALYYGK